MRKWFLKHFVFFRFLFATNESSGRRYNGDNSFGVNDSEKGLSQPFSKTDIYMDKADLIVENPMSNSLEGKLKRSKSILVPKNEDAGTKTIAVVSGSVDLDSERFVRFGE